MLELELVRLAAAYRLPQVHFAGGAPGDDSAGTKGCQFGEESGRDLAGGLQLAADEVGDAATVAHPAGHSIVDPQDAKQIHYFVDDVGVGEQVTASVEHDIRPGLRQALNTRELLAAELDPAQQADVLRHEPKKLGARPGAGGLMGQALAEGEHLAGVYPLRTHL